MASEKLKVPHLGKILQHEFMKPLGLSNRKLVADIGVDPITISRLINGKSSLSVNLAKRLGAYFEGNDAEYWLRLNAACELRRAFLADNGKIEREIKPRRSA